MYAPNVTYFIFNRNIYIFLFFWFIGTTFLILQIKEKLIIRYKIVIYFYLKRNYLIYNMIPGIVIIASAFLIIEKNKMAFKDFFFKLVYAAFLHFIVLLKGDTFSLRCSTNFPEVFANAFINHIFKT